jgi:predicted nucleic-acid-binding protein
VIALDANVLIRLALEDDGAQAALARTLFSRLAPEAPGVVAREVLVELVWSLTRRLEVPRARVADLLDGLLAAPEIRVEAHDAAIRAARAYREGADFGDAMILEAARARGADLWTFDRALAREPGARLLEPGAL